MGLVWQGIRDSLGYWKIILIVYIFLFMLACTVGIQVYHVFDTTIGDSLALSNLISGYDYTVINDFMNIHGASVSALIGQIQLLLVIYLIFGFFLNAGILFCVCSDKGTWPVFFEGGSTYFFRFVKLALFFIPAFLIWTMIIWAPALSNGTSIIESLPNEKYYFFILACLFILYGLGLIFLMLWSLAARIIIVTDEVTLLQSIRTSLKRVCRTYVSMNGKFFLLLLFFSSVSIIYILISNVVGMTTIAAIIFMFIIQQVYILFRIYWKCCLYRTIYLSKKN